jgi:hypothetical protein
MTFIQLFSTVSNLISLSLTLSISFQHHENTHILTSKSSLLILLFSTFFFIYFFLYAIHTEYKENDGPIRHEFCPFDGEMKFDYYLDNEKVCSGFKSIMSNCPSTSSLNVNFNECTEKLASIKFDCIGHWSIFNKNYLAVIETTSNNMSDSMYKCGVSKMFLMEIIHNNYWFHKNPQTYEYENDERTLISLKINSDCSLLRREKLLPNHNKQKIFKMKKSQNYFKFNETSEYLSFPRNLYGNWTYMTIYNNSLLYKDVSSFRTYFMSLIMNLDDDRYIVHTRSQCGEENYRCIVVKQLDDNVVETQISSKMSKKITNFDICNGKYFSDTEWITQGRK